MNIQQNLTRADISYSSPEQCREAIILAGGLGMRLRSAVPDLPKCMAPVAGRPFLYYVINHLRMQGIEKIIFSLGYMHEVILNWLHTEFPTLHYEYVIEEEPLGTGGAIQYALQKADTENIFIANGDTLFGFDAAPMLRHHIGTKAACTLALQPMQNFERYGVVETNPSGIITSFREKQFYSSGTINAGLYLLNKACFLDHRFPKKFSFEKDYLEKFVDSHELSGVVQDAYFIDIGIPEDYHRAQTELAAPAFDLGMVDNSWTLFLDRDGVINHDKPGGYITTPDEFVFTSGAPQLFKDLATRFGHIIVVTNQRGVGRGIIRYDDLIAMNNKMLQSIEWAGGRVDKIYFCTDTESHSFYRKPNPGMAFEALKNFPGIDLSKSIVVGNSLSDMQFGRYAGMHTAFVTTTQKNITLPHPDIDLLFQDLDHFAKSLSKFDR